MASLTVIWWRDIPAQVLARDGRRASKVVSSIRGSRSRSTRPPAGPASAPTTTTSRSGGRSPAAAATTSRPRSPPRSERLEAEYDKHRLAELIQTGGVAGGPAFPPAHDETPTGAATATAADRPRRSGDPA